MMVDGKKSGAHKTRLALSLIAVIGAAALAGCFGGDDPLYGSYTDARAAVGSELEPMGSDSDVRLGVIEPENPQNVSTGRLDVVVLLFDGATDEPIADAGIALEGRMTMHGHGTSPEEDPSHDGQGVYAGFTTLSMEGMWRVLLNVTLTDDTKLDFVLEIMVMDGENGMDGGMHDGMHGGMGSPFDSYDDARSADGEAFAPLDDPDNDARLKLLEPAARTGVASEAAPVHILLFDNSEDEPVMDAEITVQAAAVDTDNVTEPTDGLMHTAHGVYVAEFTFPTEGLWELEFEADLDGTLQWRVLVAVGEDSLPEDFEDSFEDDFGPGEYEENHTFTLDYTRVAIELNVSVEGTLGQATGGLEALTVVVTAPDGTELDSVDVEAGGSEILEISDVEAPGEFSIDVSGQGVQASYTIELSVDYDV